MQEKNPLGVYLLSPSIHYSWMAELHCSWSVTLLLWQLFVLLVHCGSRLPLCVLHVTKVPHKQKLGNIQEYPIVSLFKRDWCLSIVPSEVATQKSNHKQEAEAHVCVRENDFSQLPKVFMCCLKLTSVSCTLEMNPSQLHIKSSERCHSQIVPLREVWQKRPLLS